MKRTLHYGLLILTLMICFALPGWAQLRKQVNFSIDAPFAMRMGNYVLPPGNYVLRQVSDNDLNLFALYPENLMNEPVAMVRTVRIDYQNGNYPEHTKVFAELDETSSDSEPVIQGWTIPGLDGWEVISVVEKKSGHLRKVEGKEYKLDRAKMNLKDYDEKDRRRQIRLRQIEK